MGLLDWLKRKEANDISVELVIAPEERQFAGLDLKQVIEAHTAWKTHLHNMIIGSNIEIISAEQAAPDNLCTLGKWLYSVGDKEFGKLPEYSLLLTTHHEFHVLAGKIITFSDQGDLESAHKLLKRDFRSLSDRILLELVMLYRAGQ